MKHEDMVKSLSERVPLLKKEWLGIYRRMGEHPHAPKWNTLCGDRLFEADLESVRSFEGKLQKERLNFRELPPESIIFWCSEMERRSQWFESVLNGIDIKNDWCRITPMTRRDMQSKLEQIVSLDADLSRLVVNPTSGTTGHPIPAPNHPAAVGCYDPLIQYALRMNGLNTDCSGDKVAAIQICSQQKTIVYHTVHSYLEGAGFAKINLEEKNWRTGESSALYINDMKPVFLSGDPYSFLDYIRRGIEYRPESILSTAISMEKIVRDKLHGYFRCPVVDMYSLNETGPIAYSCPHDPSKFHILPNDIFVEVLSGTGEPVPEGERGEIAVTGGRNPYLPLLRYLTGDTASMNYGECSCGEKSPAIVNLGGRKLVLFYGKSGKIVNSIDISGIIRSFPVYTFSFIQRSDYRCTLKIAAGGEITLRSAKFMKEKIESLFDNEIKVEIESENILLKEKTMPFICELEL
jgi:phenylacetate-CoA ligase